MARLPACLIALGCFPVSAQGFVGAQNQSTTPSRLIAGHAAKIPAELGLVATSLRADGTPAFLRSAYDAAPRSLSDEALAYEATIVARTLQLGLTKDDELELDRIVALDDEWATVTFRQLHRGVHVRDGYLALGFHAGRLAVVHNGTFARIDAGIAHELDAARASELALDAVRALASSARVVKDPSLVYWIPGDRAAEARLAWVAEARSERPRTELSVYIDARDGKHLASDDRVLSARVRMLVETTQDAGVSPVTLPFLTLPGGSTDADGLIVGSAGDATFDSPRARIYDATGVQLERFLVPAEGGDLAPSNLSQADPFAHVLAIKSFVTSYAPRLAWLAERLDIRVNLPDECNAFWDGSTLNFLRQGPNCRNSGQIASVVYHEFGHGLHAALTSRMDTTVSEGAGDFLSATFRGDARIGVGFVGNGTPIRRLDRARVFPRDYVNEVHEDGVIFGSALWELRAAMIAKYGDAVGLRAANRVFLRALTQGPDLSSVYPAMIAADDDDANAENGAPDSCEINAIFRAHGLVTNDSFSHREAPGRPYPRIVHDPIGRFSGVPVISATAENASACGSVDASRLEIVYASEGGAEQRASFVNGRSTLTGIGPGDAFHYHLELEAEGVRVTHGSPENPHRGIVAREGELQIFAEGFEAQPILRPGSSLGDWNIDVAGGLALDPIAAKEGFKVLGTDLGQGAVYGSSDGVARPGSSWIELAPISVRGYENLRLELFESWAVVGTRRVIVNGTTLFSAEDDGSLSSRAYVLRVLDLPEGAPGEEVTIRFEIDVDATNALGGWTIDDLSLVGTPVPQPPANEPVIDPTTGEPIPNASSSNEAYAGPSAIESRIPISGGCTAFVSSAPTVAVALLALAWLRRRSTLSA
ncbi:MAG: M36 family metallopeptidase [Deltaproteobacteria bacterium]|nr:M36 family metallopeptidase [Deltaproteobacteria bacterium]